MGGEVVAGAAAGDVAEPQAEEQVGGVAVGLDRHHRVVLPAPVDEDFGAELDQPLGHDVTEGVEARLDGQVDAPAGQTEGAVAQRLLLPHRRHRSAPEARQAVEGGDALRPADGVGHGTDVALEVPQRLGGVGAEDAVAPPGVEAEGVELLLQVEDVVAAQHRRPVVEEPVAEPVAGFHQRAPRLAAADAVDAQAPGRLEGPDGGGGALAEEAGLGRGRLEPESGQAVLQVPHRLTLVTRGDAQPLGQRTPLGDTPEPPGGRVSRR